MIRELGPGKIALDFGPTQMNIQVSGKDADSGVAKEAALYAVRLVTELAAVKSVAARSQSEIQNEEALPEVLQRMIAAVRLSGDTDLTPMAAVAGTIADMTADWLFSRELSRVIVNNGGDIAIRLAWEERISVGIAPAIGRPATHVLNISAGDDIGGVTTSGSGGRSFTKGIATAASVLAKTAAIADACATSIANATYSPHPAIRLVRAEEIDPLTDIAGHWVVQDVGDLPLETIDSALQNGWRRANEFWENGLIKGCVLFVGDRGIMLPEGIAVPLQV